MLDAFVIEEIRRRERERDDRPVVQVPLPTPPTPDEAGKPAGGSETPERGVIIIDYS